MTHLPTPRGKLLRSATPYRCLLWLVGGLLGASLFYGLGAAPLRDYRETVYAESARAMRATPTSLVPHLNGSPHLDKPPLVAWSVALSFWIGGIGEGTARLPSVLAMLWTACVVGWMTHRLFGPGTGLLAAVLWLGTPAAQYYGRMLMTDTLFVALNSTAVAALLEGYLRQHRGWYRLGFVVCGLAALTRGLPGVIYPLGTLVVFGLAVDRPALQRVPWGSGVLLLLGITVPWFGFIEWQYPGALQLFFVQHHMHRLNPLSVNMFVALPRWQILAGFAGLMGPVVFLLPWALLRVRGRQSTHVLLSLLALAVLASVLLASGRNHPYTLPAMPPLVALAAAWLQATSSTPPTLAQRLPGLLIGLLGGTVLGALFWLTPILARLSPFLTSSLTYGTVLGCLLLVAACILSGSLLLWQGKSCGAGVALALVMLPGVALLLHVQSQLAPQESRAGLAAVVARQVPPSWPVIIANPRDQQFEGVGGWGFYAHRQVHMVAFRFPVHGPFWSLTRPAWVLDIPDVLHLQQTGQPFALVATSQALTQLPLAALPTPSGQDGQFQLWLLPPSHRGSPGKADSDEDETSLAPKMP